MLLVCRFEIDEESTDGFLERAEHALGLLTAGAGCLSAELARAADQDRSWVLVARFESVSAYRRAMSGVEVRQSVVPLLSEARIDDPAAHEVLVSASQGRARRHSGVLVRESPKGPDRPDRR